MDVDTKQLGAITETVLANDGDILIANRVRGLVWKALDQTELILEYGCYAEKMPILKLLLANAAKLVGMETSTQYESIQAEFATLMTEIRGSETVIEDDPTAGEDNAPQPAVDAASLTAHDPDEKPDD